MGEPLVVRVCAFRAMNGPLSGVVRVVEELPRRKGARQRHRRAETKSRASLAGPSDGSGTTEGGSANTSTARSSGRKPCAGPADGSGDGPKRAPTPGKEQWVPTKEYPASEIRAIEELSPGRWAFVKEVHAGVHMAAVARTLLGDEDSKVRLRMLERLLDILDAVDWKDPSANDEAEISGAGWRLQRD